MWQKVLKMPKLCPILKDRQIWILVEWYRFTSEVRFTLQKKNNNNTNNEDMDVVTIVGRSSVSYFVCVRTHTLALIQHITIAFPTIFYGWRSMNRKMTFSTHHSVCILSFELDSWVSANTAQAADSHICYSIHAFVHSVFFFCSSHSLHRLPT